MCPAVLRVFVIRDDAVGRHFDLRDGLLVREGGRHGKGNEGEMGWGEAGSGCGSVHQEKVGDQHEKSMETDFTLVPVKVLFSRTLEGISYKKSLPAT